MEWGNFYELAKTFILFCITFTVLQPEAMKSIDPWTECKDVNVTASNWTTGAMEFYYDNELKWTSRNHPDSISPMPIIINCGGNYTPTDNYCTPFDVLGPDSTHFPYTIEIDYVKVWQWKKNCEQDIVITSFNPTKYPNKLHKSVTMGSNINITSQNNQSFWGSEYVLINPQTTVDNQSNVLFNTTLCDSVFFERIIPAGSNDEEYRRPPPPSFLYKLHHP
jgi:hypothetical protein